MSVTARDAVAAFAGRDVGKAEEVLKAAGDLVAELADHAVAHALLARTTKFHRNRMETGRTYKPGLGAIR